MSKYNYYSLKDLSTKREATFYGVIVDATFPCKEETDDTVFVSTIKLIDHTVNFLNDPVEVQNNMIYVTVKSDLIEYLPFVQHVGDILRIHRGNYTHKTKRNVYLNLESKGPLKASWCIFSGTADVNNKSFDPISCSSRTFTFEDIDTQYISTLRNWARKYIKEKGSLVYPKTIKMIDRNRELSLEKDLIVHVTHKLKNGTDSVSLFVQDDTDACELVVYNIYNYIQPGDIVRIRSFKTYQKNILVLNNFSNILVLPQTSQLHEAFALKFLNKLKSYDSSVQLPAKPQPGVESVTFPRKVAVSFVDDRGIIPKRRINDIRFDDTKFWMEVNLVAFSHTGGLVQYYDESSGKSSEEKKGKANSPYFNAQFIATDDEYGAATVKLYLCSYDRSGEGFLGSAAEASKNDKKSKDILKRITDQKHSVQVLVESFQPGTSSVDRVFRIVGSYEVLK